ncbi:hypothetical protein BD560DRAFT_492833 [Blakeslea trispora]|nr:hypothetical protein BD560DRAFT_492833 [Blakeslea trispora]
MTRAKRRASCVFALRRHSKTPSCVNALEDRAEQRLVFSHQNLSEPLCLSLPLKLPDWIVYHDILIQLASLSNIQSLICFNWLHTRNPSRMTRQKSSQNSRQNDGQNTAKKQAKEQNQLSRNFRKTLAR